MTSQALMRKFDAEMSNSLRVGTHSRGHVLSVTRLARQLSQGVSMQAHEIHAQNYGAATLINIVVDGVTYSVQLKRRDAQGGPQFHVQCYTSVHINALPYLIERNAEQIWHLHLSNEDVWRAMQIYQKIRRQSVVNAQWRRAISINSESQTTYRSVGLTRFVHGEDTFDIRAYITGYNTIPASTLMIEAGESTAA